MKRAMAFLALFGVAGCGSSPKVQFFTLSVSSDLATHRATKPALVQVAAVHIPDTLDRREMVSASGPNAVEISSENRWSAPLGPMTRLVLTQDLARHFPTGSIAMPDAPVPAATGKIVVVLAQFGRQANGRVALVGSWTLLKGDATKPASPRSFALQQPAAEGAAAQAASMSALLGQLAGDIAATF